MRAAAQKAEKHLFWRQYGFNEAIARHTLAQAAHLPDGPPEIVIFAPFRIRTLKSGGAVRIANLAREWARKKRVCVVSVEDTGDGEVESHAWFPGVELIAVSRTHAFMDLVRGTHGTAPAMDHFQAIARYPEALPILTYVLKSATREAGLLVAVGPYAYGALRPHCPGRRLWYDRHDDPMAYLANFPEMPDLEGMRTFTQELERELCDACECILLPSEEEKSALVAMYQLPDHRVHVVRNGVDVEEARFVPPEEVMNVCQAIGLKQRSHVFVGSEHKPNMEAVRWIAQNVAPKRPDEWFFVVGLPYSTWISSNYACTIPDNLVFTGRVSVSVKEAVMAISTCGLCPLITGTGSSLKLPDYLAHGKLVVTTPIGMRGFSEAQPFAVVAELPDFDSALNSLFDPHLNHADEIRLRCNAARLYIEDVLAWPAVCSRVVELI
jgi:hypothetical protein